jgi:hypothetical protein
LTEQLNVHPEALRNWARQDEADAGERHDRRDHGAMNRGASPGARFEEPLSVRGVRAE